MAVQCASQVPTPPQTWRHRYILLLNPDTTFRAQRRYSVMSAGYAVPFQAQGDWRQDADGVRRRGTAHKESGPSAFGAVFTTIRPRVMSSRYGSPSGNLVGCCRR